jgi:hypothetical protein
VIRAAAPQRTDTPVVAYRAFRWRRGRLVSATRGDRWTAELHEATCRAAAGHPAPHPACHCGIHAFGSLATAERYGGRRWRLWPGLFTRTVIGAVLLYSGHGRPLIAGELTRSSGVLGFDGRRALQYRAPYGQLVALLADGAAAQQAAAAVGVPVLPKRDAAGRPAFERFAREHGTELEAETPATRSSASAAPVAPWRVVKFIRRRRGRVNGGLVVTLAAALIVLAAARLSWLVLRPALRVAWWLAWWGLRLLAAVALFCVLLALSFLGLLPESSAR